MTLEELEALLKDRDPEEIVDGMVVALAFMGTVISAIPFASNFIPDRMKKLAKACEVVVVDFAASDDPKNFDIFGCLRRQLAEECLVVAIKGDK